MNLDFEIKGLDWLSKYRKEFIKIMGRKTHAWFTHPQYKDHVQDTKKGKRIFIDNGSKVLFVGHLDTVHDGAKWAFHWNPGKDKLGQAIVRTPTCDDRLGVATALVLFPQLGINCDILLTEGEEKGNSTAAGFTPPEGKKYNWILELDRADSGLNKAEDVVCYEYLDKEWARTLTEAGFLKPGDGSFTDICELQDLACKAMNVAIGYYNNHSRGAWFNVGYWARSVELVKGFYDLHRDDHFPHTKIVRKPTYHYSYGDYDNRGWYYTKYQEGMVVRTSPTNRRDKLGKVGILSNNWRGSRFLVVSNEGFVVDYVDSYEILGQVKCDNCQEFIMDAYVPENKSIYCVGCHAILDMMPEDVRHYVTNGGRFLEHVSGNNIMIDGFVESGMVIVMGKNIIGTMPFHEIVVPVIGNMDVGSTVSILFSEGVVGTDKYEIMKTNGHEVAIRQQGSQDWFWVPIDIVQGEMNV